jgi:glycosyltransferase involved in cell wall biosynthesis
MSREKSRIRVLYSFADKLGEGRTCLTAWQQVNWLATQGAKVRVFPGVLHRPLPAGVQVHPTLAWGKLRIPYRLLGRIRARALHDYIVSRRIERLAGQIDIIHTWPLCALRTLKTAARLGIPTVLERPSVHTRFFYEVMQRECESIGLTLPPNHEAAITSEWLSIEEEEYRLADRLLCPSDFVLQSFLEKGFSPGKLARSTYGFDNKVFYPNGEVRDPRQGLKMLFVGAGAVWKGLHFALEAWLRSSAHHKGLFLIAGQFIPAYAEKLTPMLSHPSIRVLGHRNDVPNLMRESDILVLPSIVEGFGLVCAEALGSGCVPLVSKACTDICVHMENALVHPIGDVRTLTEHISMLDKNRALLARLRTSSLRTSVDATWEKAAVRLLRIYGEVIEDNSRARSTASS